MKLLKTLIVAVGGVTFSAAANAAVFVIPDGGSWWISKTMVRVMGTQIEGISVAAINAHLRGTGTTSDDICFVEGLGTGEVIGLDRKTQQAISSTLRAEGDRVFRREIAAADGTKFIARSGIYEECDGTKGGLVVVYQAADRNIALVSRTEDQPFNFLFTAEQPALVGSGSCFECGDWSSLYYDVTRRKLYWEYEGD